MNVTNQSGEKISFEYDAKGRVSQMLDAAGDNTIFGYDDSNRLVSTEYADGRRWNLEYGSMEAPYALTTVTDKLGAEYSPYAYDALGNISERQSSAVLNAQDGKSNSPQSARNMANSCPVPCEQWMRNEITFCISNQELIRNNDQVTCFAHYLDDLLSMSPILASARYASCLAWTEATFFIEKVRCQARYPQCYL